MKIRFSGIGNCWLFSFLIFASFQNLAMGSSINQAGTMSSRSSFLRAREFYNNTGRVIATEVLDCACGTLTGNGLLKGHSIKIIAKDFQFKGVVECDGECIIITTKPFDHSMCTFKGKGKFEFVIDENAYDAVFSESAERKESSPQANGYKKEPNSSGRIYSKEQLMHLFENYMDSENLFSLTQNNTDHLVGEIAFYAKENNLNEKEIFDLSLNKLNYRIDYNKQRIGKKWDSRLTLIGAMAFLGGMGIAICLGVPESDHIKSFKDFVQSTAVLVSLGGAAALQDGLTRDNHHEEKYDRLSMLKKSIEQKVVNLEK